MSRLLLTQATVPTPDTVHRWMCAFAREGVFTRTQALRLIFARWLWHEVRGYGPWRNV